MQQAFNSLQTDLLGHHPGLTARGPGPPQSALAPAQLTWRRRHTTMHALLRRCRRFCSRHWRRISHAEVPTWGCLSSSRRIRFTPYADRSHCPYPRTITPSAAEPQPASLSLSRTHCHLPTRTGNYPPASTTALTLKQSSRAQRSKNTRGRGGRARWLRRVTAALEGH